MITQKELAAFKASIRELPLSHTARDDYCTAANWLVKHVKADLSDPDALTDENIEQIIADASPEYFNTSGKKTRLRSCLRRYRCFKETGRAAEGVW